MQDINLIHLSQIDKLKKCYEKDHNNERVNAAYFPTKNEYSNRNGLNETQMNRLSPDAAIMYQGQINRGTEISANVPDSNRDE